MPSTSISIPSPSRRLLSLMTAHQDASSSTGSKTGFENNSSTLVIGSQDGPSCVDQGRKMQPNHATGIFTFVERQRLAAAMSSQAAVALSSNAASTDLRASTTIGMPPQTAGNILSLQDSTSGYIDASYAGQSASLGDLLTMTKLSEGTMTRPPLIIPVSNGDEGSNAKRQISQRRRSKEGLSHRDNTYDMRKDDDGPIDLIPSHACQESSHIASSHSGNNNHPSMKYQDSALTPSLPPARMAWQEVEIMPIRDPVTKELVRPLHNGVSCFIISLLALPILLSSIYVQMVLLIQTEATSKVESDTKMASLTESQLRMLMQV